ncbi:uncharacterized protein LOC107817146 [Nicotiana tabacum]|uniref:Uncharacterized protein LOC107817146 n=1 Tax=Nicotiana tabacum TaxID=4097 RepID=A0A1S4CBS2_TOBAC|nr:uncharacterized protein LOC104088453 [Nicotiana tomentosiformis]XP_016498404.1 PREDICTED: uncharacterized protein LOC107817146 [Nicotiana tabacum]
MTKVKLGSEKHKEEESRKRKRDKIPETPKSNSKKSEFGPSMSKSPESAKINTSVPQKTEKGSGKAQSDGLKGKNRSTDEDTKVTTTAEKSAPSTRRVKIMRELGLMAPSGSPFHKGEHVSPFIPKGRVSAPSRSSSHPKERLPPIQRIVVCGLSAASSADNVMK